MGVAVLLATACGAPHPLAVGVATERRLGTVAWGPAVESWYAGWAGSPAFDTARADAVVADGALPLLTWEPWLPGGGVDQPEYAMARIAAGEHDDYIADYAGQVRDWGGVLALRFAHEVDAPHYPWSVGVNGNTAEDVVAAWHRVREVFAEQGTDVVWVWNVNVHAPGTAEYAPLYPGDDAVDWVTVDGYNGGDVLPWGGWKSPEEIFGPSVADLRELTDRPILIAEVGSAEQGGDKAGWITQLFDYARDTGLAGLVWFDEDKEADWRIASSPASAAAFRAALEPLGPPPLPARFSGSG